MTSGSFPILIPYGGDLMKLPLSEDILELDQTLRTYDLDEALKRLQIIAQRLNITIAREGGP